MKIIENSECLIAYGDFIRKAREGKGLSQRDLAEQLGITQAYYSQIESGKRNVDLVLAMKMCSLLGINLQEYISIYMD